MTDAAFPSLDEIRATAGRLAPHVQRTPVWRWQGGVVAEQLPDTEVWLKLELFQRTGTFKLRGALNNMLAMGPEALARGVTAVSAGNHAIAVAFAARALGTGAKVVMMQHASPARVALCRAMGAEVVFAPDAVVAFEQVRRIEADEGRLFVHPFEGPGTTLGTACVGLEFHEQAPPLDVLIIPVGGGGLAAGISAAMKQLQPQVEIFGVEPEGADSMSRSFESGRPEKLERVDTVADSLGAPYAAPYTFGVCRRFMAGIVRVTDDDLCAGIFHLMRDLRLAVEPAAASATAAMLAPLRERVAGRRVGLIVCGTNIDAQRYSDLLLRGARVVGERATRG